MKIISSPHIQRVFYEQFRFPRSKKKRVLKKWAKNRDNFKSVIKRNCYILENEGIIFVHPDDYEHFKRKYTLKNSNQQLNQLISINNNLFRPLHFGFNFSNCKA